MLSTTRGTITGRSLCVAVVRLQRAADTITSGVGMQRIGSGFGGTNSLRFIDSSPWLIGCYPTIWPYAISVRLLDTFLDHCGVVCLEGDSLMHYEVQRTFIQEVLTCGGCGDVHSFGDSAETYPFMSKMRWHRVHSLVNPIPFPLVTPGT